MKGAKDIKARCSEARVVPVTCLNVAENERLSWESKSHEPSQHLCVKHDVQNMDPITRPVLLLCSFQSCGVGRE